MWYEFPTDENTFSMFQQFMFGSRMLVAPKSGTPSNDTIMFHAPYYMPVYLPVGVNWYYYWSGQPVPGQADMVTVPIAEQEQGVWIREGSVIPLLNFDREKMSLLQAINDPIALLVYPNLATDLADGDLYMDDGQTHNYLDGERLQVQFNWDGSKMTITKTISDDNNFPQASGKFINKAQIFNVTAPPVSVKNSYINSMINQIPVDIEWMYNPEESSLVLHDFLIPVDSGLFYGEPVVLFEVIWT